MSDIIEYTVEHFGLVLWVREDRFEYGKPIPSERLMRWCVRRLERDFPGIVLSNRVKVTGGIQRDPYAASDPLSARLYFGDGSWRWQRPHGPGQRRVPLGLRWNGCRNIPDEHRELLYPWLDDDQPTRTIRVLKYEPLRVGNSDDLR